MKLRCVYVPYCLYIFICWRTPRLVPEFGYYEQWHNKYRYVAIFVVSRLNSYLFIYEKKCSLWCWHKRSQDVWIRKGSAFIICAVINFASGALITLEAVFLITYGTQRPLIVFQRRGTNIFLLEIFQCETGSPLLHMFWLPTLLCWMAGEWNKEPGSRRVGRNMLQWFPHAERSNWVFNTFGCTLSNYNSAAGLFFFQSKFLSKFPSLYLLQQIILK